MHQSINQSIAPSLLISSARSPRLRGHNFCLGGTNSRLGGHGPGMPPVAPGLPVALLTPLHLYMISRENHAVRLCKTKIYNVDG